MLGRIWKSEGLGSDCKNLIDCSESTGHIATAELNRNRTLAYIVQHCVISYWRLRIRNNITIIVKLDCYVRSRSESRVQCVNG